MPDISWHGVEINKPLWHDPEARVLAFTLAGITDNETDLHIVMNMNNESIKVELPVIEGKQWCLALDTSLQSPKDISLPQDQKPLGEHLYSVNSETVAVFENVNG
jgi:glycogen operon protein